VQSSPEALQFARAQFPITRSHIYFDIANMNSPPSCVTQSLADYFSAVQQGRGKKTAWLAEVEATRQKVAALLDCDAGEIAFTKNTSEAINIAANAIDWRPGDNVVLPAQEHPNNVFPWLNLRQRGVEVRMVPETNEWVDAELLRPFVNDRTRAVAVADVSFHPGQRNDLSSIGALCHESGAYFVVDGVQAAGILQVKPRDLQVSVWAASGHKGLLTPHGLGIMYCRRELIAAMLPVYAARASMEQPPSGDDYAVNNLDAVLKADARRFELGNFNYSAIHAMSAGLDLIASVGIKEIEHHVLGLGEYLTEKMAKRQIARLGPANPKHRSGICVFTLPGDGWVEYFAENAIVLSARRGAIRISLGLHNTTAEIDRFIDVLDRRMPR
jgi:selenocysteine lyase/cysteine desulfurase